MTVKLNIVPAPGERGLIVGQTGSGKTAFAVWLLSNYLQDGVIYDTKIEPKFAAIKGAIVVDKWDDVIKLWRKRKGDFRFIVFRPPVSDAIDPDILDLYLERHYADLHHSLCYVDEILQFHNGGRAGTGLVSLLTRGRSRGITTLMSTQRPSGLSRFAWTESQKFYLFKLQDLRDRKTADFVVPDFSSLPLPPKYHSYYYDFDIDAPILLRAVALDGTIVAEYTDSERTGRHIWL